MYIRKERVNNDITKTQVDFEMVVDDLLMVSVEYDVDDRAGVFSYWRLLGAAINPPLEIGINTRRNTLKGTVLFVDADCLEKYDYQEANVVNGNIIVNVDCFEKENDYKDTAGGYSVSVRNHELVCRFHPKSAIKEAVGNDCFRWLVSFNDEICGFIIYNLNEGQISCVNSLR